MSRRERIKLIREHDYAAEVEVELIESSDAWAPYLTVEDASKLDEVRLALRRGDVATALQFGRVFRLTPISAAS